MKKFKVTFTDILEANTEEDAYDNLLDYLKDVVAYSDVTAFEFQEVN